MLTVSIQSDTVTEKNRVTMEPIEVSETDSFLHDSIHFNMGDWFRPTIQITEVSLDSEQLAEYQGLLPQFEATVPVKPLNQLSKRTSGKVTLNLCLTPYSIARQKMEESLTLYHIPVQIGVLDHSMGDLRIFIRPRDIYDNLKGRFNILHKINTNNKNSSIYDEDFEIIVKDYEALIQKIHQIINQRIARVYTTD